MPDNKPLSERSSKLLREKIQTIVNQFAQGSMDLCWAVYEVDHALVRVGGEIVPVWEAWGYNSWSRCVGVELDLHPTTAYAYKRIWETFYVDLAGAWSVDNLLGITKMRILCAADLNKRNVNGWLKKARKMTCAQLVSEVYGTDKMHSFTAMVTGNELETLRKAIDTGREAFGEDLPRGEVLAMILKEWQASFQHKGRVKAVAKKQRKAS